MEPYHGKKRSYPSPSKRCRCNKVVGHAYLEPVQDALLGPISVDAYASFQSGGLRRDSCLSLIRYVSTSYGRI